MSQPAADATGAGAPIHLLIVDDEPLICEEIVCFLRTRGFSAEAFDTPESVLARLQQAPEVTVLLTDIQMPGMDGLALAERAGAARSEATALEVVLLTGHAEAEDTFAMPDGRPMQVVRKPARLRLLADTLRQAHEAALARRRSAGQSQEAA